MNWGGLGWAGEVILRSVRQNNRCLEMSVVGIWCVNVYSNKKHVPSCEIRVVVDNDEELIWLATSSLVDVCCIWLCIEKVDERRW